MAIENSLNSILHALRFSNLHFVTQETPHSLYFTVRKKHVLNLNDLQQSNFCSVSDLERNNDCLEIKIKVFENELDTLKLEYESEISDHEATVKVRNELANELKRNSVVIDNLKNENDVIKDEKSQDCV
jgi:hypothetical protein